jgi:hypothetical protein
MQKQENSTLKSKFQEFSIWFAFFTSLTYWVDRFAGNL